MLARRARCDTFPGERRFHTRPGSYCVRVQWCIQCTTWKELQQKGMVPWAVIGEQLDPDELVGVNHLAQPTGALATLAKHDTATVGLGVKETLCND